MYNATRSAFYQGKAKQQAGILSLTASRLLTVAALLFIFSLVFLSGIFLITL